MQLSEKVKEDENLIAVATQFAKVESRKLKEELVVASRLLSEAREELLEQKVLVEKCWEKGERSLEELRAQLAAVHKKELEDLCARLVADHEKDLEYRHKEFQSQSDALYKQAFQKGVSPMKEKLGKCRRCGFTVGIFSSGQTTSAAIEGVGSGDNILDKAVEVEWRGKSRGLLFFPRFLSLFPHFLSSIFFLFFYLFGEIL